MMDIGEATDTYERWAFSQITPVPKDLDRKHEKMAESPFPFLRATFYRWAQLWPKRCKALADAPKVLAVGDLHVENFGTWRDLEGRLVWGINDFDEVYPAPYTVDLVRLAASAMMAFDEGRAAFERAEICRVILAGYLEQLTADDPKPFVLDGSNRWLRTLALGEMKDPAAYWQRFDKLEPPKPGPSSKLRRAIEERFPERGLEVSFVHRVAGMGSLGRQRILARAHWHGSTIAREAKTLLPSAWVWAKGEGSRKIRYNAALRRAIRCPDPFVAESGGWIIRRLAPDCTDIDLTDLPKRKLEQKLLRAMGVETANVHLGTPEARDRIRDDLAQRKPTWLEQAAETMVEATHDDFGRWQVLRPNLLAEPAQLAPEAREKTTATSSP